MALLDRGRGGTFTGVVSAIVPVSCVDLYDVYGVCMFLCTCRQGISVSY